MSSLFNLASATVGGGHQNRNGGYKMQRSVRLRSSASAYFNRTPGSVTNRRTMTFSFWMKRGLLTYSANYLSLFTAYPGTSAIDQIAFSPSSDSLRVWFNGSASADLITTQVFRDPSAWYHIVVAIDTTQATASNRIKVYANGSQITSFSTATYPALNYDTYWNSSSYASAIGANLNGPQGYFDGYLTEINFIDGQALTPLSFGETDPYTGVWRAKRYTGTYGNNGFYLNFSDNSAATAAAIGKDYSGNGNNWTPNNISVTAGVTYDSMLDVPTQWADGGNGRGNYAVLNPLDIAINTTGDGNLKLTNTSSSYGACRATIAVPTTGKWYWETVVTAQDTTAGSWFGVGMMIQSIALNAFVGTTTGVIFYGDRNDASSLISNGATNVYQGTAINFVTGDVLQCSYDADSGKFWFGKNNAWWDSSVGTTGDPSAGTNQTLTAASNTYFPFIQLRQGAGTNIANINFGQRLFQYSPPTGFKALHTGNLP